MTTRRLGELGITLLAIYFVFTGLLSLVNATSMIASFSGAAPSQRPGPLILLPLFLNPVAGALLWMGRRALAKRLFDADEELEEVGPWAVVGVRIVGLLMLFPLLRSVQAVILMTGSDAVSAAVLASNLAALATAGFIMIVLLAGAPRLAGYFPPAEGPASVFAALGLYLAVRPLVELASYAILVAANVYRGWPMGKAQLLQAALMIVTGIAVFVGASSIAEFWRRVRSMKVPDGSAADGAD